MAKLRYWRLQHKETYNNEQITMLATDSESADLTQLRIQARHGNHVLELWESDSLGKERHEDGKDLFRHHLFLASWEGDVKTSHMPY